MTYTDKKIVILHTFIKETQQTPMKDLNKEKLKEFLK